MPSRGVMLCMKGESRTGVLEGSFLRPKSVINKMELNAFELIISVFFDYG